jgi:tRNA nucleotidyltransferase (CCA-adding enzyme)
MCEQNTSSAEGWEHFPHGADVGIRGRGPTREAAFEQAAMALTAVITAPGLVRPQQRVELACAAPGEALLFVEWLNAVVFEMATRHMLFSRYRVHIEGGTLAGEAWGEPIDVTRHQPAVEVKGATLTALKVVRDEHGTWTAECVVDV